MLTVVEERMFDAFMAEFPFCWACGVRPNRELFWREYTVGLEYPRDLHNHHIVGSSGRRHVRENAARLCRLCHDVYHGAHVVANGVVLPKLELAHVLWLKRVHDQNWYDVAKIEELRRSAAPDPEYPPKWFQEEYLRRRLVYPGGRA